MEAPERERSTNEVGELIMEHLKGLDTVAYIRFASVIGTSRMSASSRKSWKGFSTATG